MKKKHSNNSSNYFTNILIAIPSLLSFNILPFTIATCTLIVLIVILFFKNWTILKEHLESYHTEWEKLRRLEYFFITDNKKSYDLKKRNAIIYKFKNLFMVSIIILLLFHLLSSFFISDRYSYVCYFILFCLLLSIILWAISWLSHNYTTITFIIMPILGLLISANFNTYLESTSFIPLIFIKFLVFTLLLYIIYTILTPIYLLQRLNKKIILIGSSLTMLMSLFEQLLPVSSQSILRLLGITITNDLSLEVILKEKNISDSLKSIIIENPILIDVLNYYIVKYTEVQLVSGVGIMTTTLATAYIFGVLSMKIKISMNWSKANNIYRDIIKNKGKINYQLLKKCSYYGGEEFENLILNNEIMSKIILVNEQEPFESPSTRNKAIKLFLQLILSLILLPFKRIKGIFR